MRVILISFALFGVACSRPEPSLGAALSGKKSSEVSILKDVRQPVDAKGNYKYDIELSDGSVLQQEGKTEPPPPGGTDGSLVVQGMYSYTSPDGSPVHVSYIADKDGFRPMYQSIPNSNSSG